MTSETLDRAETRGRLVVQEARHDTVWVSTVLTSQAHRRRTSKRNRRIPTIPAGKTDAEPVNVSTVDTRPRRSESGVLVAEPGASVTGPPAPFPCPPSTQGPGGHGWTQVPL